MPSWPNDDVPTDETLVATEYDDITTVLLDIASVLQQLNIAYMISGSVAANFYAPPRFTNDVDIVIQLPYLKKESLRAALDSRYYIFGFEIMFDVHTQSALR